MQEHMLARQGEDGDAQRDRTASCLETTGVRFSILKSSEVKQRGLGRA